MKLKDKTVLQDCRERYCKYGSATGVYVGYMMF